MPENCIISGATGLIGTCLSSLMKTDFHVFRITRSPVKKHSEKNFTDVFCDFSQPDALKSLSSLPDRAECLIHLAQSENFRDFPACAQDIFNVNTSSTAIMLDFARKTGVKTFVLASTGGVYGSGSLLREDFPVTAQTASGFYAGTKLCSELLAQSFSQFMNVIILRFFFVYGPFQRPDMLIPRLILKINSGEAVTLDGTDGIILNPVFVSDAALSVRKAIELSGFHIINIAGSEILSMRSICSIIGEKLGRKAVFAESSGASHFLTADITKMSQLLKKPSVSFSQGIALTVSGKYENSVL